MRSDTISHQDKKMSRKVPADIPNEVIEEQTKKIPNLTFMALAGGSIIASAILAFGAKKPAAASFVGLWAPTILILGLYNKMVKVEDEMLSTDEFLH